MGVLFSSKASRTLINENQGGGHPLVCVESLNVKGMTEGRPIKTQGWQNTSLMRTGESLSDN